MIGFARRMFSADPVSRFQYEKVHEIKEEMADQQAIRGLMRAVLQEAIACYQGYFFQSSRTNEKLSQEAEEWIFAENEGIFSFNNICETLGLNPERVRKGLKLWKARQKRIPPWERKPIVSNKGKWRKGRKVA